MLRITRHFALVTRTGPAPHGPARALRDFALGRTREKANSSALRFVELFPREVASHADLRTTLLFLGQPDRAADEAAEIARLQPGAYRFGSAIQSIRFASRLNEAKSWLAKADALKFDNSLIRRERLIVAFATGDRDNVERILKEEEPGRYRQDFLFEHSLIEIQQGRFRSAERLRLQTLQPTSKDSKVDWWTVLSALENAEVGMNAQARRYEGKATSIKLDRDDRIALALALARSGQTAEADRLADRSARKGPRTRSYSITFPRYGPLSSCSNTLRRRQSICSEGLPSMTWRLRARSTIYTQPTSADSPT